MKTPGFFRAMFYPFKGIGYLFSHHELWKYAFLAFFTNAVVLTALGLAYYFFAHDWLHDKLTPDELPKWLGWLKPVWGIVTSCLLYLVVMTIGLFLITIVGNIVAGPFLEVMTAKMLVALGEPAPKERGFMAALGRSVVNQLLKLFIFGGLQVAILPLIFTPVWPVLSGLLTVLFLSNEYWDYALEARGHLVPGRLGFLLKRPGPALGFGGVLWLVLFVPLLPYLMLPASVCGATLLVHDLDPDQVPGPKS